MDSAVLVLGLVSGIASIAAFFIPAKFKNARLVHAVYILGATVLAGLAVYYSTQYKKTLDAGNQARALVAGFRMDYTHEAFFHAGLAFLEKHVDLYPDTYRRAESMCSGNSCAADEYINASYAMKGILQGISTLEGT